MRRGALWHSRGSGKDLEQEGWILGEGEGVKKYFRIRLKKGFKPTKKERRYIMLIEKKINSAEVLTGIQRMFVYSMI